MSLPSSVSERHGLLPVGARLNNTYEIQAFIKAGGMGEVYRGFEIESSDPVAIKVVREDMAGDEAVLAMFRSEARALRRIHHGAVVRYFGFSFEERLRRHYLAMEFVEGTPLKERLDAASLSVPEMLALARRVALGLQAAHEQNVVHRDVSPDNIIVPDSGVGDARIIDFGIARSLRAGDATIIGGGFAGKYKYVSPEQLGLFGGDVRPTSDIYSLGLVLAQSLVGAPLPMDGSQVEVIERRQKLPDLSAIDPQVRPLIAWMLQPDPARRPQSMAEVADWTPTSAAPALASTIVARPLPTGDPQLSLESPATSQASSAPSQPSVFPAATGDAGSQQAHPFRVADSSPSAIDPTVFAAPRAATIPPPGGDADPGMSHPRADGGAGAAAGRRQAGGGAQENKRLLGAAALFLACGVGAGAWLFLGKASPPSSPTALETPTKEEPPPEFAWAPLETSRVDPFVRVREFARDYNGGDCFLAVTGTISANAIEIDGYGRGREPFDAFDRAFKDTIGIPADIAVRKVAEQQCPALRFAKRFLGVDDSARFDVPRTRLKRAGDRLEGAIETNASHVDFFIVDDEGLVSDLSGRLSAGPSRRDFAMDLRSSRPGPVLLVAIASAAPIPAPAASRSLGAKDFFTRLQDQIGPTTPAPLVAIKYIFLTSGQ